MNRFLKTIAASACVAAFCASTASAAIIGAFYDTGGLQGGGAPLTDSMTATENFLATNPTPDATFTSTGIDYGVGPVFLLSDLDTFLGSDASSLSAPVGATSFLGTVLTFSGSVLLNAGINTFDIFSDDGFSLKIGGVEIGRFEGLRAPGSSVVNYDAGAGGLASFELIYFEGSLSQAALTATLNGDVITGVVPLPAGMTLMLGGIAAFGALRARKKKAAA